MSEMERLIFAAAYALDFGRRMDAAVLPEEECAHRAIAFAHKAVELYRQQKTEVEP